MPPHRCRTYVVAFIFPSNADRSGAATTVGLCCVAPLLQALLPPLPGTGASHVPTRHLLRSTPSLLPTAPLLPGVVAARHLILARLSYQQPHPLLGVVDATSRYFPPSTSVSGSGCGAGGPLFPVVVLGVVDTSLSHHGCCGRRLHNPTSPLLLRLAVMRALTLIPSSLHPSTGFA